MFMVFLGNTSLGTNIGGRFGVVLTVPLAPAEMRWSPRFGLLAGRPAKMRFSY